MLERLAGTWSRAWRGPGGLCFLRYQREPGRVPATRGQRGAGRPPLPTLEHPCQTPTSWSPQPGRPERQTLSKWPAVRVPGAEGGGSHLLTYLEM